MLFINFLIKKTSAHLTATKCESAIPTAVVHRSILQVDNIFGFQCQRVDFCHLTDSGEENLLLQ